jgi:hypothetical protein
MAQFTTWYHGTGRENADGIALRGLYARAYGRNHHGVGVPYHVLARDRHQAMLPSVNAVVTLHVSNDDAYEYLTFLDSSCWCQGMMSGLMKPLPIRMIHAIEDV